MKGKRKPRRSKEQTDVQFTEYRRAVIRAVAADDELSELLVLKGGNALRLVHEIGARTSQDIDYSLASDFKAFNEVSNRLEEALKVEFLRLSLHVVDFKAEYRPKGAGTQQQAEGYRVEFKLAPKELLEEHPEGSPRLSVQTEAVGPDGTLKMEVQISKNEYCAVVERKEFGGYAVLVSAPALIAAEKLRALCQQMPEYTRRSKKTARARDFYDLHAIVTERGLNVGDSSFHELIRHVFEAKKVALSLLGKLSDVREFHRPDWAAVEASVPAGALRDFDFYVDFALTEAKRLEPLWMVDPPSGVEG